MDRREFVKCGAAGLAGLALSGVADLPWFAAARAFGTEAEGPWKFGVMADTQWKANLDGKNPGTCAVDIINKLNAEFINHGVDFVVQVGDLVDSETDSINGSSSRRNLSVRATAAQALYDAGIGFFPVRGNHEASKTAAAEMQTLFPQNRGLGSYVFGATNFNSPSTALDGLSYSFDFNNVRLVLIDQFTRVDGTGSDNNNAAVDQVSWVDSRLSGRAAGTHAFVMSHKNLIGGNHGDVLFGSNPATNPAARNALISSMQSNGARYQIGGHDHMHHRSIVTSPDGTAAVKQLICSSNSYKFYIPQKPSNDARYNNPTREIMTAEELYSVGYYIFTVDGPRLTVDFYSTATGFDYGDVDLTNSLADGSTFFKRESWGYSLNGKEFVVAQGEPYTTVSDSYEGTSAAIIGGTNKGTETDYALRPLAKTVNTGWAAPSASDTAACSHVLSLWGMADNLTLWDGALTGLLPDSSRTDEGDTYALQMSFDTASVLPSEPGRSSFGIAARDDDGTWVNAVDKNHGGTKKFVVGPYSSKFKLGTYGYDARTKTVWAVVNHEGDFAVARGI